MRVEASQNGAHHDGCWVLGAGLNYHYYQALTKAAFKPAAFFRGILLPLCTTSCSLRKAVIFASVVAKTSIPVLHSAVALMKLAEMHYAGVTSLFIRVLCDKKYALPHRVLDALVQHFVRTAQVREREGLPRADPCARRARRGAERWRGGGGAGPSWAAAGAVAPVAADVCAALQARADCP